MNDLIISSNLSKRFPKLEAIIKQAANLFDSSNSFEDVETLLLRGAGLSPHTYRSYLTAIWQLYEFTEGLNPLQVTPGHIEAFYDDLVKRVDRNTAYLRVRGLKRFFAGIRNVLPIYTSPFEIMSENLHRKLNKTKKGNRTRKALSVAEVKRLLTWLEKDGSAMGQRDYAIVFMLVTSGLRSAELVQLHWKDLEYFEGTWTAWFIGKGNREAEQELYTEAVGACRRYYREQFKREGWFLA